MALLDSIPEIVYNAANSIGGTTWDVTLKKQDGSPTKTATGGWSDTTTSYTGRGLVENYSDAARTLGGIPVTDRKIIVFAYSFTAGTVPEAGDLITAESTDYEIINVSRDPAAATYTLQVR